jgi:hypothetical protein
MNVLHFGPFALSEWRGEGGKFRGQRQLSRSRISNVRFIRLGYAEHVTLALS